MQKGEFFTVVFEVQNVTDALEFRRVLKLMGPKDSGCSIKAFVLGNLVEKNESAQSDVLELMNENANRSHDGIDA